MLLACIAAFAACSDKVEVAGFMGEDPEIFPDYRNVTIPPNIAPMNFEFTGNDADVILQVESPSRTIKVRPRGHLFSFRSRVWKEMLEEAFGRGLVFRLYVKTREGWYAYNPFVMNVAKEPVDPYLAYRLIPPGYSLWNEMSICQRDLESFRESRIYSNRQGRGNCVNCHSFCSRDPERMLLHMRSEHAGTYVYMDGRLEKLDTKTPATMSSLVYPYWHPSGRYVAFSVNKTNQVLHASDPNRIEVFDEDSDIVVYDVLNHEIVSCDRLKSGSSFETFPTFSPDGRYLYFCSAEAVTPMPERYQEVKYSLCRIGFDPDGLSFGGEVDTLYNARTQGRSASFPRVSPDGRLLAFTLSDYGNFSIWHKDADIHCLDTADGSISRMGELNSDDVESYHSWSSDGRWLVFSSRRGDGLYTRPYFAYVDGSGYACKPFLLPQKNPKRFYGSLMFSYNIPEFVSGKVRLDGRTLADFADSGEPVNVSFRLTN